MAVIEPDGSCKDGTRWAFASRQQGEFSNYKGDTHFDHGKVWTDEQKAKLLYAFRNGLNLHDLNRYMGRTNVAIVKQLYQMKMIQLDTAAARWWSPIQPRDPSLDREAVLEQMAMIQHICGSAKKHSPNPAQEVQNLKEETMSLTANPQASTIGKVETRIFVDNVAADTLTLDELLAKAGKLKDTVHKLEGSADDFEKFGRVPAALKARIAEHRKNLGALLDLIDQQFPDTTSD